jgi:hypothetical protein
MSGSPMSTTTPGGLITMADGCGIRFAAGHGFPMRVGDGASAIMAGGIGASVLDGTGFRPALGALPGSTGTAVMTTTVGVLSVIGATPSLFRITTFTAAGMTDIIP